MASELAKAGPVEVVVHSMVCPGANITMKTQMIIRTTTDLAAVSVHEGKVVIHFPTRATNLKLNCANVQNELV